jgi:hypothetical protein
MKYLPEIINVFRSIVKKTDQLEELSQRVNDLLLDELMKDLTLHRFQMNKEKETYTYEVKEDDFKHISEHIYLVQNYVLPDIVVMLQSSQDQYKVMFRVRKD